MNSEFFKKVFNTNNILFFIMLVGSFIFGYKQQPTEMGLFIVAGAISLAFANISKIQRFKGAGFFEAEMRAELEKVVEDANVTINTLRAMAKPIVISLLTSINYDGRFGGIPDRSRKYRLKDDIVTLADSLNLLSDNEISQAIKEFFTLHAWDHIVRIRNTVIEHKKVDIEAFKYCPLKNAPSVEDIRKALSDADCADIQEHLEPLILDYDYFLKNEKLRRPEMWGSAK